MAERRGGIVRGLVTTLGTLVVISLELLLLLGVYHRADSVHDQRVDIAQMWGVASVSDGTGSARAVQDSLPVLRRHHLPAAELRTLDNASRALAADPSSTSARTRLLAVVRDVNGSVAGHQRNLDDQAALIYGGMLVIASVGWFLWFRRLVIRHRALQAAMTEQQALADSERRLQSLVQNSHDVILVVDADSTITFASRSLTATLGHDPETVIGSRLLDTLDEDNQQVLVRALADQSAGQASPVAYQAPHADGHLVQIEGVVTNLLADTAVGGYVVAVRDVTEEYAMRARLTRQAFYDPLTGLANRQLFSNRLQHALTQRSWQSAPLVVLFCDLDDFKLVNDAYGHPVGDKVLTEVAARLAAAVRPGDTAARFGGDEFAILMEGADVAEGEAVARRVLTALAEPIHDVTGATWQVTASIGIASAEPGASSADKALRDADVAMYWAKERGKSAIAVYDPALHAEAQDRLQLRAELQQALRHDQLVLHYQPTVDLTDGDIIGFEALVRWQHPTRGLLAPGLFIDVAEQAGLIGQLGSWVLAEACRTAAALQADPRQPSMAVNVSAQQLADAEFVEEVHRVLVQTGLDPQKLTLEITETMLLADVDAVSARLSALQGLGVRIAIDDFGTGYSSLAYLKQLPVDVLKVDKSFIDEVANDAQSASVTQAVLSMAQAMRLRTVAEGVEKSSQADWLRAARCDIGQGYLWSRPLPVEEVRRLLASTVRPPAAENLRAGELTEAS